MSIVLGAETTTNVLPPWALDAGTDNQPAYTGADVRALFSGLFKAGSSDINTAQGILKGLKVTNSGQNLTVTPGTGVVLVDGTPALVGLKASTTLRLTNAASKDRRDIIVLQVTSTAGTGRGAKLKLIEGTPGSGAPSEPYNGLQLGVIDVRANGRIEVWPSKQRAGLNVEEPTSTTTRLSASGYNGNIYAIRSKTGNFLVFDSVQITGVSSNGTWRLSTSSGSNSIARSRYTSYGWVGQSVSGNEKLYVVKVTSNDIQVLGIASTNRPYLSGVIPYMPYDN